MSIKRSFCEIDCNRQSFLRARIIGKNLNLAIIFKFYINRNTYIFYLNIIIVIKFYHKYHRKITKSVLHLISHCTNL